MNPRERYLATLLFGRPDLLPLTPGGPRESTLEAWRSQGLAAQINYLDALSEILDVPRDAFDARCSLPQSTRMIPTFEEKVLEHRDGHYVVQDWMGAITEISDVYDYTYIRRAKDFVTRKWHRFPVQSPADWEQMAWRYDASDPRRLDEAFWTECARLEASGLAVTVSINGPFWQMREWVGMEGLCTLMLDEPQLVQSMSETWQQFTLDVLGQILERVRVDALMVSEDMAYKAHSMISPAMVRRYLQPTYLAWAELLRSHDVPLYDMDSDGYIEELIPIWIESGINCCNPIEVAAGNDLVHFRERFGVAMAYHGGIDKRAIAVGGETMRQEVMRVAPALLQGGGYLPSCDHGVPSDISWPNFVSYTRLLAELSGWL